MSKRKRDEIDQEKKLPTLEEATNNPFLEQRSSTPITESTTTASASTTSTTTSTTLTVTTITTTTVTKTDQTTTTIIVSENQTYREIVNQVPIPELPEKSIVVTRVLYDNFSMPYILIYDFNTPEFTGRRVLLWEPKCCSKKGLMFTSFITQITTTESLFDKKKELGIPWQEAGRCEQIVLNSAVCDHNEELTRFLMKQRCDSYDLEVYELKAGENGVKHFRIISEKEQNELYHLLQKYYADMPMLMDVVKFDLIAELLSKELLAEIKKDHFVDFDLDCWITITQLKEWLIAKQDPKNAGILKMIDVIVDAGWPIEKRIVLDQDQLGDLEELR